MLNSDKDTRDLVDSYILEFPLDIQKKLKEIRVFLKSLLPNALETMAYGIPTYKIDGKNLVHFGGAKKHIGFYPSPKPIEVFKNELTGYKCTKGTIQFPLDKELPLELIKKIVEFRLEENN